MREVVGVEFDPAYAARAADRLDLVITGDVEQVALDSDALSRLGVFDCILAGDILEHLRDPWQVLRSFSGLLADDGIVIVSVPNVRHWKTFWHLGVKGRWPRHAMGIYDRDHLRWFTRSDAIELLEQAGVAVERVHPIYRFGHDQSKRDRLARRLGRTPLRAFFTFQMILVGRRVNEPR